MCDVVMLPTVADRTHQKVRPATEGGERRSVLHAVTATGAIAYTIVRYRSMSDFQELPAGCSRPLRYRDRWISTRLTQERTSVTREEVLFAH